MEDRAGRAAESSPFLTRSPGHRDQTVHLLSPSAQHCRYSTPNFVTADNHRGLHTPKATVCAQEGLGSWEITKEKSSPEQHPGSAALEAFCLREPARGTAPHRPASRFCCPKPAQQPSQSRGNRLGKQGITSVDWVLQFFHQTPVTGTKIVI